jgi:hypothetical protein
VSEPLELGPSPSIPPLGAANPSLAQLDDARSIALLHQATDIDAFLSAQRDSWLAELASLSNDALPTPAGRAREREAQRLQRSLTGLSEDVAVWRGDWGALLPVLAEQAARGQLDAEWVALAPAGGMAVWRLVSALYAQQLSGQGHAERAAMLFVGCGMVVEAVGSLLKAKLFAEAAVLCQARLLNLHPLTQRVYEQWAQASEAKQLHAQAALSWLRAGLPLRALHALLRDSLLPPGWSHATSSFPAAGFAPVVPACLLPSQLLLALAAYAASNAPAQASSDAGLQVHSHVCHRSNLACVYRCSWLQRCAGCCDCTVSGWLPCRCCCCTRRSTRTSWDC